MFPNRLLVQTLIEAYQPCRNFGVCPDAIWNPIVGHIPRGFLGATGELDDVKIIMVVAEPGGVDGEIYDPGARPIDLMMAGIKHTYACFSSRRDQFHRNGRWFMAQLFPGLGFDEQLRHIWLTECRLCSIKDEIGKSSNSICSKNYLSRQIEALPNATVIAFGGKAKKALKSLGVAHLGAFSLAPPGANQTRARPSWEASILATRDILNRQ